MRCSPPCFPTTVYDWGSRYLPLQTGAGATVTDGHHRIVSQSRTEYQQRVTNRLCVQGLICLLSSGVDIVPRKRFRW